ncbi:MAG TPA: type II CAAX endopeptidase family protein [Xanthobacteraceae bacterium]|nr:type II CAAX endopeptidase family protein [Xanthobacteraceae bacterium]
MSTMTGSFDLPHACPLPAPLPEPRPWGFWATLGWGVFAAATGFFAAMMCAVIWILSDGLRLPDPADAAYSLTAMIAASLAPLAVLVIAAKMRKWPLRAYFALGPIRRRDLALGIACLTALIVVSEVLASLTGVDEGSRFMDQIYRSARLAGMLPLLWLGVVVVAPVSEELLFRGFLHRGWAPSRLGAVGTVVLTSGLWAALHQQYDWAGILAIFLMGLLFGWLRQRSGSTMLIIVLHGLNNLAATLLLMVKLEWLS